MSPRLHGTLDGLTDSEQRPLRPIGTSVREVASRTGRQLTRVAGLPGVRLFSCVTLGDGLPPIAHAVAAGRRVLLVESVAWPCGVYTTAPDGGVLCDGVYIGQSVRPLVRAVRRLRRALPRPSQVGAVVVVHPSDAGVLDLPKAAPAELIWLPAGELAGHLGRRLRRDGTQVRPHTVGALAEHLSYGR